MARQRPADYLPAHVLARPDFVQACAERDLGKILLLAKRWGGVGYSASHLARRCELTVSRVQDYVSGRVRAQSVVIFERVADGLHIPGALLDLGPRPWESEIQSQLAAAAGDTHGSPTDGDSTVLRRDFIKVSTGVAAALATGLPGVPTPTAGNRVGGTTVEAMRSNLKRLRALDDHLGGADTFRLYRAEVDKLGEILKSGSFSSSTSRELYALLSEQAQQAGWAAFDAGWNQAATQLFERSFEAARESQSSDLAGNALALRSYQLLSAGTVPSDLTDRSLSIAGSSAHPAVRSLLYQRGAWTHAVGGQAEQAAWALGQAADALGCDTSEGPAPDWASWAHSPLELDIMVGRCWAELHRPMRAIPALESAMSQYDDSHARDKALYLTWLADAYLDAGEVEQAAAVVSHSLDLASRVASTRPKPRITAVLGRLTPHKSVPAVRELLAR